MFLYTGNFYENMVFRSHMRYNRELDRVEFHQAIIKETTQRVYHGCTPRTRLLTGAFGVQWRCSTSRKISAR